MLRILAKLSWIAACVWFGAGPAATARAELIVYSWSGLIEMGASLSNPWGLSGDGNSVTPGDGSQYTISVTVDSAATERPGNSVLPGEDIAYFIPTSVDLQIDGLTATGFDFDYSIGSDYGFRLWDNVNSAHHDSIGFRAAITYNGITRVGGFDNHVSSDTFDLISDIDPDSPALFDSATLIENAGTVSNDLTTFGGTVSSETAVPEPSSMLLVAVVGGGAAWRRWRTSRKTLS